MSKFKVVLLEDRYEHHDYEKKVFESIDAEVIEGGNAKTKEEIIELCKDADGITVNLASLDSDTIAGLKSCKAIGRYGVGYDNVDLKAATEKGIALLNVTDYCLEDVSDQAFALFMACVRKTSIRDRQLRAGMWNIGKADPMFRITGKTFGIAGYGNIPQVLHRKLQGFNLERVLVFDPFVDEAKVKAAGAELVDLDTLLKESDYVSCHVPLNDKTKYMFNKEAFEKMKKSALFINTSRGGLVDTDALYNALKSGEITCAGLDVHEEEPVAKNYSLFELDNVILSDHTGWYSEESQVELQTKAAQGVADVLTGKAPKSIVNPEVLK